MDKISTINWLLIILIVINFLMLLTPYWRKRP